MCSEAPSAQYGNIVADKVNQDAELAQAVGQIVYSAQAMVEKGGPQYPFGGLPNFPEAYPILLSGNAQSNTSVGESVTGAAPRLPPPAGSLRLWLAGRLAALHNPTLRIARPVALVSHRARQTACPSRIASPQCWPRAARCSAPCPPRCPPLTSGSTTRQASTSTRQSRWAGSDAAVAGRRHPFTRPLLSVLLWELWLAGLPAALPGWPAPHSGCAAPACPPAEPEHAEAAAGSERDGGGRPHSFPAVACAWACLPTLPHPGSAHGSAPDLPSPCRASRVACPSAHQPLYCPLLYCLQGEVSCTTEYGRTYYLTIQFTFLAFLTGMQVRALRAALGRRGAEWQLGRGRPRAGCSWVMPGKGAGAVKR